MIHGIRLLYKAEYTQIHGDTRSPVPQTFLGFYRPVQTQNRNTPGTRQGWLLTPPLIRYLHWNVEDIHNTLTRSRSVMSDTNTELYLQYRNLNHGLTRTPTPHELIRAMPVHSAASRAAQNVLEPRV